MHSYKAQFSWMWLSVFTSYFQRTKLSTSRHKIPIVFKLLINISIAWNGFFFKISIIGEVIVYVDYCICNKIWNHRSDACWHNEYWKHNLDSEIYFKVFFLLNFSDQMTENLFSRKILTNKRLFVFIAILGWPKSSFWFLSKNKRHIFHFHQELY